MAKVRARRTVMTDGVRYEAGQVYDMKSADAKRMERHFELVEGSYEEETPLSEAEKTRRNKAATQPLDLENIDQTNSPQNPPVDVIEGAGNQDQNQDDQPNANADTDTFEAPRKAAMKATETRKK